MTDKICHCNDALWHGLPCPAHGSQNATPYREAELTYGWNVEQILVYIWQCLSREESEQEYPFSKFANSEMGKRLRLELDMLSTAPQRTGVCPSCHELGTHHPECPGRPRKLTAEDVFHAYHKANQAQNLDWAERMAEALNARLARRGDDHEAVQRAVTGED